jgi:hypothetical protein
MLNIVGRIHQNANLSEEVSRARMIREIHIKNKACPIQQSLYMYAHVCCDSSRMGRAGGIQWQAIPLSGWPNEISRWNTKCPTNAPLRSQRKWLNISTLFLLLSHVAKQY